MWLGIRIELQERTRMDKLTLPAAAPGRPTGRFDVRNPAAAVVVLSAAIFVVREGVALFAPLLVSVLLALVTIKAAADHIEPLQPLGELLGR
jgi:hypothetical protein